MTQKWNDVNLVDSSGNPITLVNPLHTQMVNQVGVVSSLNSSIIPLGIGGVFTGAWEDTLRWAHIAVQVYADQVSATDGLEVQWSSNSSDIDQADTFDIPANEGKVFTFGPSTRYFRIVYTNGALAQSTFRLSVIFKPVSQKGSSHRIKDSISTDDDAELCKSVVTGESQFETGQFKNVKTDHQGRLLISGSGTVLFEEVWVDNTIETTEKWTNTQTLGGSNTVTDGILKMSVPVTSGANTEINSQQFYIMSSANPIGGFFSVKYPDAGTAGNNRMFGFSSGAGHPNGFFFWLAGTTFYARTTLNTVNTSTDITPYLPLDGNFHEYHIRCINGHRVEFYIDGDRVATHLMASTPLSASKNMLVHLHNHNFGTLGAGVDLYVNTVAVADEGKSATQLIGSSFTSPTVLRTVKTDKLGRLITVSSQISGTSTSGILSYDTPSKGPLVTNTWERVLTYPIPTDRTFNLIQFQSAAANNTQIARCVKQITFGTKNYATSFTAGNSLTTPQFASRLYALVTTTHSATTTVLTATYTNQDGVTGRMAVSGTLPSSAPANTMFELTLQAGDFGVRAVTAVSHTNALTGVDSIIGIDELGYHRDKTADFVIESIVGGQAIIAPSGVFGTIGLDFNSTNTTVARLIKVLFTLSDT